MTTTIAGFLVGLFVFMSGFTCGVIAERQNWIKRHDAR